MKKFLTGLMAALVVMSLSTTAFAQNSTVDLSGLSDAQKNQIAQTIAEDKKTQEAVSADVRGEAVAWGDLGKNMGTAIVGAAKEVGVAANQFAATPLGKITVAVVVYKMIGRNILGLIFGTIFLIIGLILSFLMYFGKILFVGERVYEVKPFLFGLWQRKVKVSENIDSDVMGWRLLAGTLAILATLTITALSYFSP